MMSAAETSREDPGTAFGIRELRFELGRALLADGRTDEARASLEAALREPGDKPAAAAVHLQLSRACLPVEPRTSFMHVVESIRAALTHGAERLAGRAVDAGLRLVTSTQLVVGDELIRDLVDLEGISAAETPVSTKLSLLLGYAYLQDPESSHRAVGEFDKVLAHLPRSVDALRGRAVARRRLGYDEDARRDLEEALAVLPPGQNQVAAAIGVELAQIEVAAGHYEQALKLVGVRDGMSEELGAEDLLARAQALLGLGDHDAALATVEGEAGVEALRVRLQARLASPVPDADVVRDLADELRRRDPLTPESVILHAEAVMETGIDVADGRRQLREVLGESPPGDDIEHPVVRLAQGGRHDDARLRYFLAEYHTALVLAGPSFHQASHLSKGRQHLEALRADRPEFVTEATMLRLDAELRPAERDDADQERIELDAASGLLDDGDAEASIELLERAQRRSAVNPEISWLLFDSYLLDSYGRARLGLAPPQILERVRQGTEKWDNAFLASPPTGGHTWAYATRAQLAEQRAYWDESTHQLGALWEALAFQEVAVLFDPAARRLEELTRLLQNCSLHACAMQVARWAVDTAGDSGPSAMLSLAASEGISGMWDQALERVESIRALGDQVVEENEPMLSHIEVLVRQNRRAHGDAEAALRIADRIVAEEGARPWLLGLRAELLEQLDPNQTSEAWEQVDDVLRQEALADPDALAAVALRLGRVEDARRLAEEGLAAGAASRWMLQQTLGLAQLALGDTAAATRTLTASVETAVLGYQLDDLLDRSLPRVLGRAPTSAGEVAEHIRKAGSAKRQQLKERPRTPLDELDLLDSIGGPEEVVAWRKLCSLLGRLRLGEKLQERRRLHTDLAGVAQLLPVPATLARVAVAFYAELLSAQTLTEAGALLAEGGEPAQALELLRPLLDAGDEGQADPHADALAGYAALRLGEHDEGRRLSRRAAAALQGGALAQTWAELVGTPQEWAEASRWLTDLDLDDADAPSALASGLDRVMGLANPVPWPGVAPLRLELGGDLLPDNPYDPEWPFIVSWIPAMRQEIEAALGVPVPGIRASRYPESSAYVIRLEEAEVGSGAIDAECGYVAFAPEDVGRLGIDAEAIIATVDPVTLMPSSWVLRKALPTDFPHETDPLLYVLRDVGAALRRHLDSYVSVDLAGRLLDDAGLQVPDDNLLVLTRVLALLARDRVPLVPIAPLVEVVSGAGVGAPLDVLVDRARAAVRERLPGNRHGDMLAAVPEELERVLENAPDLQPWPGSGGRGEVEEHLAELPLDRRPPPILVCQSPASRRAVARVLASTNPDVAVIARQELLRP